MNTQELLLQANKALAEGRLEDFLGFCAPDVTMRWPGSPQIWNGTDEIRKNMGPMLAGGAPWTIDVEEYLVDGNRGMGHGSMTMRQPDGSTGVYHFSDIYHFRDGKIKEIISYMIFPQPAQNAQAATA